MSYVSENLMPNERVYFSARIHPAIFVPPALSVVFGFLLLIPGMLASRGPGDQSFMMGFQLCVFGIFLFAAFYLGVEALILMATTEFAVTNRRVIAKTGLLRRHTLEMLLQKVESVAIDQNLAGRIFNFGTVIVIGTGGTRERFRMISSPLAVRMKINQLIEASSRPAANSAVTAVTG